MSQTPGGPGTGKADSPGRMNNGVLCPFCGRDDTRLLSPFGGQLSVAQYWCQNCRTGFDYMKWEDSAAPAD